jgi:NADPH-dependent 2,4-dienoyl-CoA reductase/sulfur reductase-like enzyme
MFSRRLRSRWALLNRCAYRQATMATEFVRDFGGRIPLTDLPEGHPVDGKVGNQEIVVVRTVEVDAIGIYDLQTFDDATRLAAATASAKRVVVLGASFIGLETAASLHARGIEVNVVAPDPESLAKVLGEEVGRFIRGPSRIPRCAVSSRPPYGPGARPDGYA